MHNIIYNSFWGSTDWILSGLALGLLGSYYMSKNILFSRYFKEKAMSYYGYNPYEIKSGFYERLESAYGFIALSLGYICQIIGVWWAYEGENWKSIILSNWFFSLVVFFVLLLINSGFIKILMYFAGGKFKKFIANDHLNQIDELILTVENGYLGKELRKMTDDERKNIFPPIDKHIENAKKAVKKYVVSTYKLLDKKSSGKGDLEDLSYLRKELEGFSESDTSNQK